MERARVRGARRWLKQRSSYGISFRSRVRRLPIACFAHASCIATRQVYMALSGRGDVMADALRDESTRFAASTYALSEALYEAARQQEYNAQQSQVSDAPSTASDEGKYSDGHDAKDSASTDNRTADVSEPRMLYWHLTGKFSLSESDPQWKSLEVPDETGFVGLTSTALVKGTCESENFPKSRKGYAMRVQCTPIAPQRLQMRRSSSIMARTQHDAPQSD